MPVVGDKNRLRTEPQIGQGGDGSAESQGLSNVIGSAPSSAVLGLGGQCVTGGRSPQELRKEVTRG